MIGDINCGCYIRRPPSRWWPWVRLYLVVSGLAWAVVAVRS